MFYQDTKISKPLEGTAKVLINYINLLINLNYYIKLSN